MVAERRRIKNWSYPFLLRFIESERIVNCIAAKTTKIVYTTDIYAGTRRVFCGTWFIKYLKKEIPALSIPARYSKLNDFNQSLRVPFHIAFYDFCENRGWVKRWNYLFFLFFSETREWNLSCFDQNFCRPRITPTRYQIYSLVYRSFSIIHNHVSTP